MNLKNAQTDKQRIIQMSYKKNNREMLGVFSPADFKPPFWLANPHVQTILPKILAKPAPCYRRELIKDSLNESDVAYDFYDAVGLHDNHIDTNKEYVSAKHTSVKNEEGKYTTPIIVLFHGLEGSSGSHYACTIAHRVHEHAGKNSDGNLGWNFVLPHYRSCGGVPVKGQVFYNAGDTAEIHHVLKNISKEYTTIFAMGVSLGGNMLAKYMGEYKDDAICKAAVVASAPVDLSSSSIAMKKVIGRYVYTPYLLKPLVEKALMMGLSKDELDVIKSSKSIYDFDLVFTAPRHGYRSVNDYYCKASALPFLKDITKPTLIITAKDDPFLGLSATVADISEAVVLMDTEHGGHIGFIQWAATAEGKDKFNLTWLPDTAIHFFETNH